MKGKRGIGEKYEARVGQYLVEKEYTLVAKNFRFKHFEIDIIAVKKEIILFAEVKYRSSKIDARYPSVSKKQQKNIRDCAKAFMQEHPEYRHYFGRFDIFLITPKGDDIDIQHFKNNF